MQTKKVSGNLLKKDNIIFLVMELILFMSVRWLLLKKEGYNWLSEVKVTIVVQVVVCVGFLALYLFLNKCVCRLKQENIFAVLYLSIGIIYMLSAPLSSTPDETEHMLRAYGVAQGDFIPELDETGNGGSYIPSNLLYLWNRGGSTLKDMRENYMMTANADRYFATYSNTALYSPLTYAPQALGILLTKPFNRPYIMAYAGRLFELLAAGILFYISIKIIPVGKNILLAAALMPINMYECASLSGGGFAFAIIMLLIAYVMWLRYEKQGEMTALEKIYVYLIFLFVASCKIVYVPFVLLAFAIPKDKFGTTRKYVLHIIIAAIMVAVVSFGWLGISGRYLLEYNEGVDSAGQVMFILKNPLNYVQVIHNTVMKEGEWLIKTFLGGYLGYFEVSNNILVMVFTTVYLVYVCSKERIVLKNDADHTVICLKSKNGRNILNISVWSLMMICTVLACILVFTSLYVQWTPVGNPSVDGLQGRYYIPFILPIMLCVKKKTIDVYSDDRMLYAKLMMCFVNLLTIATLIVHYI